MSLNIHVQAYRGIEASVNAFIFSDNNSIILADCLRNSSEAKQLADLIKKENKQLTQLLITHGHPDHYLGMNIIKSEFPDVKIVVADAEIKNDIISFSNWMESVGWMDNEPAMKPKSANNPAGFDYENNIRVLESKELKLDNGAALKLNSEYKPAECEHLTTIYSKDLNAFFANDFCYQDVHPWLAVDRKNIEYWKNQLSGFKKEFSNIDPIVYPGHGPAGDISMFDTMKKYIEDFEGTVATARTRKEAMEKMKTLYPRHEQADFLLLYSVNAFIPE